VTLAGSNGTFRLDNKVAVVTGGGSGIGHSIAEIFAGHGAFVHIVDMDQSHAECVAAEIRKVGGKAQAHICDVSIRADVKRVFDRIMRDEPIDILVNNAGIAHVGKLEDTSEADFDRVFQVNVKGVYNCMHCCIEHMKSRREGVILNLASIASSAGLPDRFAYSMSKGAVLTMTYSVARDYMSYNIRCNCISPARVYTPFVEGFVRKNYPGREKEMFEKLAQSQPIGRMAEPKEVASLALFLCSNEASFITGVDYPIDGGFFNLR
jgi:NAD(P)-dependent dehydrogenase (short-subunit alcohol dehydrogenase family)